MGVCKSGRVFKGKPSGIVAENGSGGHGAVLAWYTRNVLFVFCCVKQKNALKVMKFYHFYKKHEQTCEKHHRHVQMRVNELKITDFELLS